MSAENFHKKTSNYFCRGIILEADFFPTYGGVATRVKRHLQYEK
jgi:hypothetical protein